MAKASFRAMLLVAATLTAACTIKEQTPPPFTGPSEFGLSLRMQALPDTLTIGGSPSTIVLTARNADGSAAPNVQLRLDIVITVNGRQVVQDFGTLSTKMLVTGSDGRASAVYTPPPLPPPGFSIITNLVTIVASLVGTNQQVSLLRAQTVDIRLVLPSTNNPNSPIAFFTFSPTKPKVGEKVIFNATGSYPVPPATAIATYTWDWGDGGQLRTQTNPFEDNEYLAAGTYFATLTVTDNLSQKGSTTQAITVTP